MASLRLCLVLAMIAFSRMNGEPNPPEWPETVQIFSEDMPAWEIQDAIDEIFMQTKGEENEFSSARVAFFFKPGIYSIDVPVGYYTSVYGLGSFPDDVIFNGSMGVYSEAAGEGMNIRGFKLAISRSYDNPTFISINRGRCAEYILAQC